VAWLLTTAVAASLTGQRQDYHTMSAWPAFALLVSRAWDGGPGGRGVRLGLGLPLLALGVLGAAGLFAYRLSDAGVPGSPETSAPFGARNSVVGVISGIAGAEWRRLRSLLLPAAGGLLLAATGGLALVWRSGTWRWSWAPIAAGTLGTLLAAIAGLQAFAPYFGLKTIALALERRTGPDALVVFDGPSHQASSFCFYTDVPLRWIERADTEFAVRSRAIGRDRFVTEGEVARRWRAGEAVWLITEESRLALWRDRLGDLGLPVARSGTRTLVGSSTARGGNAPVAEPAR
jgi:hypothetical protein